MNTLVLGTMLWQSFFAGKGPDLDVPLNVPSQEEAQTVSENPVVIKHARRLILEGTDCISRPSEIEGFSSCNLKLPEGEEDIANYLKPFYLGKDLTLQDLVKIKIEVGKYFYQHGRPFVRVAIPEQDVTDGTFRLKVVESKAGEIRCQGNRYFSSKRLLSYIRTKPGELIEDKQIANDLYLINTNPFRQADIIYSPGEKPDTTDITLQVWDRRPWRLYSGFDNTGIVGTGRVRWFAGFEVGNMFWLDHIFNYQYTTSLDFHQFQGHTVEYVAPLSWRDTLTLYGGYAQVHADLDFPGGKNTGRSYQASLRYDIPMFSDQFISYQSRFGFDFKRTNSNVFFQEIPNSSPSTPFTFTKNVNLTQFIYGWQFLYQSNHHNVQWFINGFASPGQWISDQTNSDYESIRPGAKNHWVYGNTELVYEYKFPCELFLRTRWIGQVSSQNLIPSEQLPLGGYNSVRGYDERQESKDSGVLASIELRSPLWPLIWKNKSSRFQLLAFLDYGWGTNHTPFPGEPKSDWMMGVGPGFRYTFGANLTARFDWGFKLHERSFYTGGSSQAHFSVIGSF